MSDDAVHPHHEPVGYAYEMRHSADEEWVEVVKSTHPGEAWADVPEMEWRNVRPLVEAEADE